MRIGAGVAELLATAREELGGIDIYFANAGIDHGRADSLQATDEGWGAMFDTNVLAHVRAAHELMPDWVAGQGGRFVVTASAAGLLTMLGSAAYSVTKHAAVAFAEWLSITYGGHRVIVQAICPQGVRTRMLDQAAAPLRNLLSHDLVLTPHQVANAWVESLEDNRFLVLPHPEVAGYYAAKAADIDRWLGGMRRVWAKVERSWGRDR